MKKEIDYVKSNYMMWNRTADVFKKSGFEEALLKVKDKNFKIFDDVENRIFTDLINVEGKNIIQIGCNSGLELLYLKKIGANRCVGVDISDKFIDLAKQLSEASMIYVDFVCTDIFNISKEFYNKFNLVYISVGVLGWLPDIRVLFKIINKLLVYEGEIFIYEQHPILGMFNPKPPHQMDASYFQVIPFEDDIMPEYIDKLGEHKVLSYWFPYKVSDIISACIKNKLQISHFEEYSKDISETYKELEKRNLGLPLSFTLIANKSLGRKKTTANNG